VKKLMVCQNRYEFERGEQRRMDYLITNGANYSGLAEVLSEEK
jgi:hypothetical protein